MKMHILKLSFLPGVFLAWLTGAAPAFAIGVMSTDGTGCPSIADHQRFGDEMDRGNYTYQYPSRCVDLPKGTRVSNPVETRSDRFGEGTAEFILVEVAGKGRYWTLASWVDIRSGQEALGAHPVAASRSDVWFARVLRSRFGGAIPIHGYDYPIAEIACLPTDITHFEVSAETSGSAFSVAGSLELAALPHSFRVIDGAKGPRYMLHLQAYLFSPTGRLVWKQQGFPQGNAWVNAAGGTVHFRLIGTYDGPTAGHELLVIAAGDPILSEISETRVILGAKRLSMP